MLLLMGKLATTFRNMERKLLFRVLLDKTSQYRICRKQGALREDLFLEVRFIYKSLYPVINNMWLVLLPSCKKVGHPTTADKLQPSPCTLYWAAWHPKRKSEIITQLISY